MSLKQDSGESSSGEKNKAGERNMRKFPHVLVLSRNWILEFVRDMIVNELVPEKKQSRWAEVV